MTKLRAPLSIDQALARIAGALPGGWADMAAEVEKTESYVRKWGDPESGKNIPLSCAILLDLAYQSAGGEGSPLFECYAARLDQEHVYRYSDGYALRRLVGDSIKEAAEAHCALIEASMPSATERQRQQACREIEEAIATLNRARPLLSGSAMALADALTGHNSTGPPD